MVENPIANSIVLAVFSAREDRTSLASIFAHSTWKLRFTRALLQTQTVLGRAPVGVVISEAFLSDGNCWKDLLNEILKMEDPPPLIVTDRLADEHLWAEVLNLGAYDLIAKPFDAGEVLHAVTTACSHREDERARAVRRKPATPAKRGGVPGRTVLGAPGR